MFLISAPGFGEEPGFYHSSIAHVGLFFYSVVEVFIAVLKFVCKKKKEMSGDAPDLRLLKLTINNKVQLRVVANCRLPFIRTT
ncbi:TPA: hypothetical protein NR243_003156 [Legionella pneumophila]|nr:hypothetical protein [Legionella pneumophila]